MSCIQSTALAAAIALACAPSAHAEPSWFQFEAGLGMSTAIKTDGLWYWAGADHSTPVNSPAGRAGIQFNISDPDHLNPGVRMHLTYNYFGHYNWHANAGFDSNATKTFGYNRKTQSCFNNDCGQYRWFDSVGNMQFVALTVEPFWNLGGGWNAGIELGPAFYFPNWNTTATAQTNGVFGPAGTVQNFHHTVRLELGALGGVSIGKGPVTLRVEYLYAPVKPIFGENDPTPAGIRGGVMTTLNYTW